MRSRYILSLLLLLAVVSASAQRVLTGVVVSAEDSVAMKGATVECSSAGKSVGKVVTGENGAFSMRIESDAELLLQVSFVGYETYYVSISESKKGNVDLGQLWLMPASENLEGVTVNAELKQIDRSVVFPTTTDVKVSYDIFSLLRTLNLNGLSVNEINKSASINGKSIQWKINGVPKNDDDIKNIKPKDILRVEYSDMPSMRELDKGSGGVVNIILKEKTDGGRISIDGETAFTAGFVNGGMSAEYNKGKSSIRLDYSTTLRDYDEWKKDETSSFVSPEKTINRDIRGKESEFGYFNNYLTLNYTLQPDNMTQFSVSLNNTFGYQHHKPEFFYMSGADEIHRKIYSTFRSYLPSLDIFFGKWLSQKDRIEANVVGTMLVKGRSRHTVTDMKGGTTLNEYSTPSDSKRRSLISEVFYSHVFDKGPVMSFGVQNILGKSRNDYFEPAFKRDELDENNTYVYAQAWGRIGKKLQYSLGTGMKYNRMDNGLIKSDFWRNQSSLGLGYTINNSLFMSYNMYYYPTVPGLYALTSVSQQIDDLQVLQGNPYLKSAQNIQNSLYLSFVKNKFNSNLSVSFTHTSDPIFFAKGYDEQSGMFTQNYVNGIRNNRFNVDWRPSLKGLFGFLNLYCNAGFSRYWAKTNDFNHALNNFYWSVSVQMYYKQFSLSAFYKQPEKTLYNENLERGEKSSRVTLMWQGKGVTVYASLYNPFTPDGNNYLSEYLSKYNPGRSKVNVGDNGNMFTLSVSLDLNFGKSYNKARRNINNADSGESILRAKDN